MEHVLLLSEGRAITAVKFLIPNSIVNSLELSTMSTLETAEKEVQDTFCQGSGGAPHLQKVPQDWGVGDLLKAFGRSL